MKPWHNESDVVFLCLPHKAAQEVVPTFLGKTKIIDFSADFRLSDKDHLRALL